MWQLLSVRAVIHAIIAAALLLGVVWSYGSYVVRAGSVLDVWGFVQSFTALTAFEFGRNVLASGGAVILLVALLGKRRWPWTLASRLARFSHRAQVRAAF